MAGCQVARSVHLFRLWPNHFSRFPFSACLFLYSPSQHPSPPHEHQQLIHKIHSYSHEQVLKNHKQWYLFLLKAAENYYYDIEKFESNIKKKRMRVSILFLNYEILQQQRSYINFEEVKESNFSFEKLSLLHCPENALIFSEVLKILWESERDGGGP